MSIVRIGVFTNRYSKRKKVMSVKNETVVGESEQIVDDISNEESNEEIVDQDVMAQLKAKMAKKKAEEVKTVEEPVKEVEEKKVIKIIEKKKRSINIGVCGTGQAGSRVASTFAELGYKSIAINTAIQDLSFIQHIPESNKLHLDYGPGGTSKELSIGLDSATHYKDEIYALIADKLSDCNVFLLATSLGGGSGAGGSEVIIDVMNSIGLPVIVLTILPQSVDDSQTKSNALTTLSKFAKMVQNKQIANLILIDNAKIETIFADVSQMDFFDISNRAICLPIDAFNKFSAQPSKVKSLDPAEALKLFIGSEGLSTFGEIDVFNFEEPTAIAEAVINNMNTNLLAGSFDLAQTKYAGVLFVGHPKVMSSIPSSSVNYAMSLIRETCPSAESVFRGIYEDPDMEENVLKVYSLFTGMGLPSQRVDQLRKETLEENAKVKGRDQARNLSLQLDSGTEATISSAEQVRNLIKKQSSAFHKSFVGIKDFRKK